MVAGTVDIAYNNNSPDTLKSLAMKLYPNLYNGNTMRNTDISLSDLGDGIQLSGLNILIYQGSLYGV